MYLIGILFAVLCNFAAQAYEIVGYYPNWAMYRTPSFKPEQIDGSIMTRVLYAFVDHNTEGKLRLIDPWADIDYQTAGDPQLPYQGNFKQLYELKKKYPKLKTMLSVGGWTLSNNFSVMAANPIARKTFAQECVAYCQKYHFDGIDIDWEYPTMADHAGRPEDTTNYTLLLQELYAAAKAAKPQLLVSIAAPAGEQFYTKIELDKIHQYLDAINIMTYDFAGTWDKETNHQANIQTTGKSKYSIDKAINYYLSQGVPAKKIILGIPLYGRSFANAAATPTGLYSTFSGSGKGTFEPGMAMYYDLKNRMAEYQEHWDDQAQASYLFNPTTKEFVTFDSEKAFATKCDYIKKKGLGGAMVWELGGDQIPQWNAMKYINNCLGK